MKLAITIFILTMTSIFAEVTPAIKINFTVTDNGTIASELHTQTCSFGLDPLATDGIDTLFGESLAPSFAPSGLEARLILAPFSSTTNNTWNDFRGATFPFTGQKEHRLIYNASTGATSYTIHFSSFTLPGTGSFTIRFRDAITGSLVDQTLTSPGDIIINSAFTSLKIFINYSNVSQPVTNPMFTLDPVSLNFHDVSVGSSSNLPVTISNSGTGIINITNIKANGNYSFSSDSLPFTLNAGSSSVINVTFSPAVAGIFDGSLVFTHDAEGSPTTLELHGNGVVTRPIFNIDHSKLDFWNVAVNQTSSQNITVSNTGTGRLVISSITTADGFTINPTSATIQPNGNQTFKVTFQPASVDSFSGNISFTYNSEVSPFRLTVTGNGVNTSGVIKFNSDQRNVFDAITYIDTLNLELFGNASLNTLQFKLLSNVIVSNNKNLVILNKIIKGRDVASASWSLDYEIKRGPRTITGASKDTVIVHLYNTATSVLTNGLYSDLLRFEYEVVDIIGEPENQTTDLSLKDVNGSSYDGTNSFISSGSDQVINVANKVQFGDVSGDNELDIQDLFKIVDHILTRKILNETENVRADIEPWAKGMSTPTPDKKVDVQDLTLLQNIILTGKFPSGAILNNMVSAKNQVLQKSVSNSNTKLIFDISKSGINIYLNSDIEIRGVQLNFKNIMNVPENLSVETNLGTGFFANDGNTLRILLYDKTDYKTVNGSGISLASIPFYIYDPLNKIYLDKIILIDSNNEKVENFEYYIHCSLTEIKKEIPVNFSLSQNYPNPFNPVTNINFSLPKRSKISLTVYNLLGKEVRTLTNREYEKGFHSIQWNGKDNIGMESPSGVYIYKLTTPEFTQLRKMILLK